MKVYQEGTQILCPTCGEVVMELARPITEFELVHPPDVKRINLVSEPSSFTMPVCGACFNNVTTLGNLREVPQ